MKPGASQLHYEIAVAIKLVVEIGLANENKYY
jgi:hypothetical protein